MSTAQNPVWLREGCLANLGRREEARPRQKVLSQLYIVSESNLVTSTLGCGVERQRGALEGPEALGECCKLGCSYDRALGTLTEFKRLTYSCTKSFCCPRCHIRVIYIGHVLKWSRCCSCCHSSSPKPVRHFDYSHSHTSEFKQVNRFLNNASIHGYRWYHCKTAAHVCSTCTGERPQTRLVLLMAGCICAQLGRMAPGYFLTNLRPSPLQYSPFCSICKKLFHVLYMKMQRSKREPVPAMNREKGRQTHLE